GQAWAALHVSLLGNHVLPFRLGEALRVTSVLRRTPLRPGPVITSTLALRPAALLAVVMPPSPGYFGRLRLPRHLPARPAPLPVAPHAPVVALIPVHNEEETVGEVVRRLPATV